MIVRLGIVYLARKTSDEPWQVARTLEAAKAIENAPAPADPAPTDNPSPT